MELLVASVDSSLIFSASRKHFFFLYQNQGSVPCALLLKQSQRPNFWAFQPPETPY